MRYRTKRLICFVLVTATALTLGIATGNSQTQSTFPAEGSALPRSMKGYELYSWLSQGRWNFTLITGTNAFKTVDQITTGPDWIQDGFVKLTVQGVDALKAQLRHLPQDAEITWETDRVPFKLPPQKIVNSVVTCCKKLGLDLRVSQ
jgi:hypothetical protein